MRTRPIMVVDLLPARLRAAYDPADFTGLIDAADLHQELQCRIWALAMQATFGPVFASSPEQWEADKRAAARQLREIFDTGGIARGG